MYVEGDEVFFLNRPNMDPRTVAKKDAGIPHSKLSDNSNGPHKVVRLYEDVVIINLDGVDTPVTLNRLTKAPPIRTPPANPNTVCNNDEIDAQIPVGAPPTEVTEDLDVHLDSDHAQRVNPGVETAVQACVSSHHTRGIRTIYEVQMENGQIGTDVPDITVTRLLLAAYWRYCAEHRQNPHNARRGRPRLSQGGR